MRQHPPYVIEPPDIIKIDAVRLIPRPPYLIEPLDTLMIQVAECLPNQPINGIFPVSPDGLVSLGFTYGTVRVVGLTPEQAALAVRTSLKKVIKDPQVSVALAAFRGATQTQGVFLVGQDGSVNLGTYGSVCIAGMTVQQAKAAIEHHLSKRLLNPEIAIEVLGYNSKVYYVIFDGAGFGEQVFRLPITGNDTVLSALSQLGGLPPVSSKRRIWLARPTPCEKNCYQVLPIDWEVMTQAGDTKTNYQLFPGDRIYIDGDPWITFDRTLAKIFAPIERVLGIGLLGTSMWNTFGNNNGGVIVGGF
jgi:polysaccharide export outer membrane protein